MGFYDAFKDVLNMAQKADNIDLYRQLLDLSAQALEMQEEIIKLTEICNETFVHFIKTSTGFGPRGASLEDIKTIREHKNEVLEIKASGSITNFSQMNKLIEAGATRIGTSHSVDIVTHMNGKEEN